ncbi:MAG: hypothetical protein ABI273_09815 [Lacunisphaera sp.]
MKINLRVYCFCALVSLIVSPMCLAERLITTDMATIESLSAFIYEFRSKNGHFPASGNAATVAALSSHKYGVGFAPKNLSSSGELLDANGHPFIILSDIDQWCLIGTLADDGISFREYVLVPPKKNSPKIEK